MPRDIPVGNRRLLVCFDSNYHIRDLYYPHVGQENHVGGDLARLGVWTENHFSWVNEEWKRDLGYEHETLVTRVVLYHEKLQLLLVCNDAVDFHETLYLREITVENLAPRIREVRLFFSQNFSLSGNSVGDTAAFDPKTGGIVHYKGNRYFLANGQTPPEQGLFQFATGQKGMDWKEGSYRDAEDGLLSGNPIAQGSVDSVLALSLTLEATAQGKAYYWIAAGKSWEEVRELDTLVKHKGAAALIARTAAYWRLWVNKESPPLELLPEKVRALYRRSLLLLATQIDWQGGILAANDSDVIQFNRDTYSYIWPRDGALVANALDLAGYPVPAQDFYRFVSELISKEGFLFHKYNPDGSVASSWHPWFQDGKPQLPIQEDETALVVWALWNHFVLYRDIEFIKPLYRPFIKKAADFMCEYRDPHSGLPRASYDLWEERRGILSFTVGAVFGGLTAASLFCTVFGETGKAQRYREVAAGIRDAASTHLWRKELNRFCRMIKIDKDGNVEVDATRDASLWGLFAFGLYAAHDHRVVTTMGALEEKLWVKTAVGGMARYEDDDYYRVSQDIPGNPWFICTLWMADFLCEKANNKEEMRKAVKLLEWVTDHALSSGVLAEQVHPLRGDPLSVSPLTWSHATFVATCQHILRRLQKTSVCPQCGLSLIARGRSEDWIEKLYSKACTDTYNICRLR